jgi:hypothetical protein
VVVVVKKKIQKWLKSCRGGEKRSARNFKIGTKKNAEELQMILEG